jgi:hypothetical protein
LGRACTSIDAQKLQQIVRTLVADVGHVGQKFAWKGLRDNRGGDALSFLEGFDLKKEDYQELGRLYDLLNDAQSAACTWVKQNPSKWQHLVRFPERKSAPFFCPLNSDSAIGLCNETKYMIAGILFWLQMTLFVVIVSE